MWITVLAVTGLQAMVAAAVLVIVGYASTGQDLELLCMLGLSRTFLGKRSGIYQLRARSNARDQDLVLHQGRAAEDA